MEKKESGPRNKIAIIISVIVAVLVFVFLIPLLINWMFEIPALCDFFAVDWEAKETLDFYAQIMSFIGTVTLGVIAVYQTYKANKQTDTANSLAQEALTQTERANELAAQMQKLEQAKFVSMISVKDLVVNERSVEYPKYRNPKMLDPEILDMVDQDYLPCRYCYHVDVCVKNESEYPIVQMSVHASGRYDDPAVQYGIKDVDSTIYIPPKETQNIRFLIPTTAFEKYKEYKIVIDLTFVNVFDYATYARLSIEDVSTPSDAKDYSYRLKKLQM